MKERMEVLLGGKGGCGFLQVSCERQQGLCIG